MRPLVTTPDKVAFLADPLSYPAITNHIDVIETHMSWVFMTGTQVYKLKKPVKLPFVDFSTRKARRRNCEAEVAINRRLAPNVYLGVVPLCRDCTGRLSLGGDGEPIDYLVHMLRLPREQMLDEQIRRHRVNLEAVREAATNLIRFYASAPVVRMASDEYLQRISSAIVDNALTLREPRWRLSIARINTIEKRLLGFIEANTALLASRARSHIVEGHGDLRPEHVCLCRPPVFIDALEFNRDLRLLDPLDELGFLALEATMLGDAHCGRVFVDRYLEYFGLAQMTPLLDFYQAFRALLRAKLQIWHLHDDPHQLRENWRRRAGRYLQRAAELSAHATR